MSHDLKITENVKIKGINIFLLHSIKIKKNLKLHKFFYFVHILVIVILFSILKKMLTGIGNFTEEEWYSRLSPTPCWQLKIVSYYCVIMFSASLAVNGVLMMVFIKNKELRTPVNVMVIWFTALSFFASLTEPNFVVTSNFQCRYTFLY